MMGAASLFDNLSLREKTAIMAVLSRDRQLRENEEERVMKLRIGLATERRHGALVAGKDTTQRKRTCARCRDKVGILESARCRVCKHVICKKCRVYRTCKDLPNEDEDLAKTASNTQQIVVSTAELTPRKTPDAIAVSKNPFEAEDSESSYPKELNPFESNAGELSNEKSPDVVDSAMRIPIIKYEVIGEAMMTSTPYDPRLGKSLVGGETRAMMSPARIKHYQSNPEDEICRHDSEARTYSDFGHTMPKRQNVQTRSRANAIPGNFKEDDWEPRARRKLYDDTLTNQTLVAQSADVSNQTNTSLSTLHSYTSLATADDSDSRHVLSDSSAYMTAIMSPAQRGTTGRVDGRTPSTLSRKSNSTGYLPEFDEKEAVEFLMQIGAKYKEPEKPVNSPEHRKETSEDDILSIEIKSTVDTPKIDTPVKNSPEESGPSAVEDLHKDEDLKVSPQKAQANEQETKTKRTGISSIFLTAVDAIAKELQIGDSTKNVQNKPSKNTFGPLLTNPFTLKTSDTKDPSKESKKTQFSSLFSNPFVMKATADKPPRSPKTNAPFGASLSKSTPSKSTSKDVVSKFKDLLLLNPPPRAAQNRKNESSAAKLFMMASKPQVTKNALSRSLAVNETPQENPKNLAEDTKPNLEEIQEPFEVIDPEKISIATGDSISVLLDSEVDTLQVETRQATSNPNSPFRTKKEALSASTDDVVACMSEASAPSEEEHSHTKKPSSSDAPSTSSSDDYHYYVRRRTRSSTKIHPPKCEPNAKTPPVGIKDSGYSTHEYYLNARNRSRYMRATRLSRRARARERDLRRLGRKSFAKSRFGRTTPSKRESSSDPSDDDIIQNVVSEQPVINVTLEGSSANTNLMGRKDNDSQTATPEKTIPPPQDTLNIEIKPNKSIGTPRRKSSTAKILIEQLKNKMKLRVDDSDWVCRVCDKALEVRRKTGDWFYTNTRPEVIQFKEILINNKRRMSGEIPIGPIRLIERVQQQQLHEPSPLTVDSDFETPNPSTSLKPPLRRLRSNTLPCNTMEVEEVAKVGAMHRSPSYTSLRGLSVDMSQMEASLQRQRMRMGRKSIAEVLHGTLLFHVPDPQPAGAPPKFLKKQSSMTEKSVPACIKNGPDDVTILRGNPISLCCALGGTPPLKSVWRKGKHEIKSSSQCNLDVTDRSAALTIKNSARDDSGCYIIQVKNSAGVDQYSINVSVVDVPDPPGQPHVSDTTGTTLVLSWYGTGYDGGSTIIGYRVEMADVTTSTKFPKWGTVASAKSTSCTVKDLKPNSKYIFRVCAENRYGMSAPGQQSDMVLNTITDVAESSEDEETFVKHGHVSIKTDGSFPHRYETKERLGQGRFGKVHRVVSRDTGKEFAAKIMRALKAKDKEAVQQEIDIMNSLRHPRLVQLVDAYSHGREITMVMDLVSGGELFERVIDEDFELTEAACVKYMNQICGGLKYMHDAYILHLDLKPENIMCINKTGTQIKIIDFGLARKYNPKEVIRVMFGTPEFVAPEVINYDSIGPETDMWSVGVICYILLSGLSPFMGDNDAETLSNITAAEWDFDDEAFDDISLDAKDFIKRLLVKNRDRRFNVDKALEHKWFKKDTEKMSKSKLNTKNLKRFLARRKWQKTGNAVRALGRLASLANLGSSNSNPNKISNGQPRESGFLAALKAQLLRENEEEQDFPTNCKPMFETLFDDVEVIEGSAAKFECTIIGTPDPEIMWYKDGEPIKESRHFKISYTEDDTCTLLITDTTESDEAEYTCKAVNVEGETEHRAELIVITPGV